MTEDGVSRRAEIDAATVSGLQLINGGAAAALTAMLPTILGTVGFRPLAISMLVAIAFNALGLAFSVVHNRLMRKCSLEYAKGRSRQPPYKNRSLRWCSSVPNEPPVCTRSVIFMWASLACFLIGVFAVMIGATRVIDVKASPSDCWEIHDIRGTLHRIDRCTGDVWPLRGI